MNISCQINSSKPDVVLNNTSIVIDSTYKSFNNKSIYIELLEADKDSTRLILKVNNNKISSIYLPNSQGGYAYGCGFNDSFDADNLISQNFKRALQNDIIIVQYFKRYSHYYYFKIDSLGSIVFDRIFTIFRYSNNYGIEPEIIEINQYLIGKDIVEFDFNETLNIEKRIQQEISDNQWKYQIKPNSETIELIFN
ncbi:MAG TPA: hypothetical protein VLZ83_11225 [Edaphocola sp.]|nr:hypothetical protein [Edaphocola sp.]